MSTGSSVSEYFVGIDVVSLSGFDDGQSEFMSSVSSKSEYIVGIDVVPLLGADDGDGETLLPDSPLPPPCGFSKDDELPLLLVGEGGTSLDAGLGVNDGEEDVIASDGGSVGSLAGQSFDHIAVSVQ